MSAPKQTQFTRNGSNRSPVSPSRITRLQEKEEMQNLNDRLVIYIDTVRRLESENHRLQSIVATYNETSTRDVSEIKRLYENELEDAKRLIDELAREKARIEIDLNKMRSDSEESGAKLAKREKDMKALEARFKASESEKFEYKSRYESALSEHERNSEELKHLKPLVADYEKTLAKLKKQLEDETLSRVDLENKNQTLKEELAFKSQVYGKELDQLKSSKRVEIEQVDVRLRDEYDSKLVSELQMIRDQTEEKIAQMRDEVERRFQNKYQDVEAANRRHVQVNGSLKDENVTLKVKCEELTSELKTLTSKVASNDAKIRDLEEKLKRANAKYDKDMSDKDAELVLARKEIEDLLAEYQELYDIKIALDMEISAYRKLLESEEQRLNISGAGSHVNSALGSSFLGDQSSAGRNAKKRRLGATFDLGGDDQVSSLTQTQQTSCGLEIGDHDLDGKCIKLTNKSDKDVPVGSWTIKRTADGQSTEFKFNKAVVVKVGQTVNVWSSNAGVVHDPPNDLVMNSQKWVVGDKMITCLVDKDAKEQARRESQRSRHRTPNRQPPAGERSSSSGISRIFNMWSK